MSGRWTYSEEASARNYRLFEVSGQTAIDTDLPSEPLELDRALAQAGISPCEHPVDAALFRTYLADTAEIYERTGYRAKMKGVFLEKACEHHLSLVLGPGLGPDSLVVDVAAASSCFPEIVQAQYGCRVIANDLNFPPGLADIGPGRQRLGCDASNLPLAAESVDLMTMHCALEMFEAEADTAVVREAARVLKPGGRLVVVPLYLHETYHVLRDPKTDREHLPELEADARLVYRRNYWKVAFARFYGPRSLKRRLFHAVPSLQAMLHRLDGLEAVDPSVYARWALTLEKRTPHETTGGASHE